MSPERHPCPQCSKPARLIQMTCNEDVYHCGCGMKFKIRTDKPVTCAICRDTKCVGHGDPCPHCEDRRLDQIIESMVRY